MRLSWKPEQESAEEFAAWYLSHPWVCLTDAWEDFIRRQFP